VDEIQTEHSAREELARRTAALAQSNADLEQFAYVVSHDLQQPLNTISRHLELLAEELGRGADGDGGRFLSHARQGAEYMQRMLDAILRYSRIETRGEAMAPTPLGEVLGRVVSRLADEIEAAGAVVRADPLPTVRADAAQMEQLLTNLLANALKFRGETPPEIHVGATDDEREWLVSVRDNGIGIDPAAGDRIFSMFGRLHTREEVPGTGIGLAICKRIVARHGGRIWVESSPGRGSTFSFALPKESDSDPPSRQGG
jgi:light-regulated signal transduction histidine kinase (bacteriophytochrome)